LNVVIFYFVLFPLLSDFPILSIHLQGWLLEALLP